MKTSALIAILALLAVIVGIGAYLVSNEAEPQEGSEEPEAICVAQYVSHPLLDSVYKGFRDELQDRGFPPDAIEYSNANGDQTTARILAEQFCTQGCDIIFALATPMAQSVKSACPPSQPILFGAITDPISAGLVKTMETPGTNLTGTSDQWPYRQQVELIQDLWGANARAGVPFNPAEANTRYAMDQIRSAAKDLGLTLVEVPVNNVTEVAQAIESMVGKIDLVYLPADNTVISAAPAVVATADRAGIPVFAGDPGTFEAGASVGLGVSYENLGHLNAAQALAILAGAEPSTTAVETSSEPELFVSEERLAEFGISLERLGRWQQNHERPAGP